MSIDTLLSQALAYSREKQFDLLEPVLRQILSAEPHHRIASLELARVLILARRFDDAVDVLDPLANDPDSGVDVHRKLALAHSYAGRNSLAVTHYRRVLEFEPDNGQVLHSIANLEQAMGLVEEAAATYRRAIEVKPLWTMPAAVSPPQFRVLLMFAPGAGNTPVDYLINDARFESHIFTALNDFEYDIDLLRSHTDVVVNLVSDADNSRAILGTVEALADRIGRPVINHPRLIANTDRATVSGRLAGTTGCVVPRTRTFSDAQLQQLPGGGGGTTEPQYPLLVRPVGTHGGEDFEKVDDRDQLEAFLSRIGAAHYYVTPFVDYRSEDGYFRKYRFIYVGDEILPYHLAIDEKWKIHHATTPMTNFPWMQDEERDFLADPWRVFGAPQQSALRSIRNAIGLDYFGIDCSLTPEGEIVVFEVNATMLVHGKNEGFPYKNEAVGQIRQAFHSLLERTVRGAY
ncbi:MAG TPA: tetratricopeptide repeat protein [Paraburkholderia sp.]|jgi:glutathione synthase/RimK-type ligase-like ATP-grasp enzyme|nr:tetratricopeptide repeat protein [Paraburkholderia sp.]